MRRGGRIELCNIKISNACFALTCGAQAAATECALTTTER